MAQAKIPPEIREHIVKASMGCPETLQALSITSRALSIFTRPLIYRHVEIYTISCLVELVELLWPSSMHSTIPKQIMTLVIWLESWPQALGVRRMGYNSGTFSPTLNDVLEHFTPQVSLTLSLPWTMSRHIDWEFFHPNHNLRHLTLHGTFPWISDIASCISRLLSLETLIVDASFKSDLSAGLTHLAPGGPYPVEATTRVSTNLRSIYLSSQSLPLMRWMCTLQIGPDNLHIARIKVDCIRANTLFFLNIHQFLKRYGAGMIHLYVWFEESMEPMYEVLGNALRHVPRLRQLELFLPASFDQEQRDIEVAALCPYVSPSTLVRIRAGNEVGVDEAELWERPSLCTGSEGSDWCRRAAHGSINY